MHKNYILIILLFFSFPIKSNEINISVAQNYKKVFNKEILSTSDISKYQKILTLQKNCEWKIANKIIMTIDNEILIGHILAQKYLHPKCYRSQFLELSSWLKNFNDHPQANRIYRLALRRIPDGYKKPKAPISAIGVNTNLEKIEQKLTKYKSKIKLTKNQKNEKRKLLLNIKSRINSGWPTGALKLLKQKNVKNLLDSVEIDQQKELIAKGYFLANKNQLAIKYANEAIARSKNHVSFANWTAGLSAWRLKDFETAANFFKTFSIELNNDPWHKSSGAFWAARSYEQLNNYEQINYWLDIASVNNKTFYGQLASNIIGLKSNISWTDEKLSPNIEKIFLNYPAGKRIMALIQVGLIDEAEREIIKLNKSVNKSIAFASLKIANEFNFAHTQLKIASKLTSAKINVPIKYFYPIPNWIPKSGYTLDKSLIFAFMHQESTFNKNAKSYKGAVGLMQLMPSTAIFISKNKKISKKNTDILKNPEINIEIGQNYLRYLLNLDIVDNNTIYLAAAYNAGPGNLKKWLKDINYNEDPLLFMESIPSRETRWFIKKILTKYWIYKNQFNESPLSLTELAKGNNPIYKISNN